MTGQRDVSAILWMRLYRVCKAKHLMKYTLFRCHTEPHLKGVSSGEGTYARWGPQRHQISGIEVMTWEIAASASPGLKIISVNGAFCTHTPFSQP